MKDIEKLREMLNNSEIENKKDLLELIQGIERNLSNKKYGLVWEDRAENIKEELKNQFVYLVENENRRITKSKDLVENLLIEGDNLESLLALQYCQRHSYNAIVIDPPYNTGNKDFKYNDRFIEKDDKWRHSCWLSFMNQRLKLAKELLTEDGVIFICIDDNEQAQLKLLCDEIFGEENFVANIAVELSKTQGMKVRSAQQGKIVKNHEYILVYSKNVSYPVRRMPLYDSTTPYDDHFDTILTKVDGKFVRENIVSFLKKDEKIVEIFKSLKLALNKKNIDKAMVLNKEFNDFMVYDVAPMLYRTSMIKSDEIQELDIESGEVVEYKKYLLVKNSRGTVEQLQCFEDTLKHTDEYMSSYSRATIRGALWKGFYSDMMNISKEGGVEFKNGKKPVRLIKQLLKWATYYNKDAKILDFFAGSGTTGHAVLELNKEDGGRRQFVLCTNNEENICEEITYKRLKNVSDNIDYNLRYYKVKKVEKTNNSDVDQFNLLNKTVELIQVKEDAFDVNKVNEYFTLIENKSKIIALYHFGFIDISKLEDILERLASNEKEEKVIYMPVENASEIYDYIDDKYVNLIRFEKMPKELIQICNAVSFA